jgi:hypothetical protein
MSNTLNQEDVAVSLTHSHDLILRLCKLRMRVAKLGLHTEEYMHPLFAKLKADHKEVKSLLQRLLSNDLTPIERRAIFSHVREEYLAHASAEKQVLFDHLTDDDAAGAPRLVEDLMEQLNRSHTLSTFEDLKSETSDEFWLGEIRVLMDVLSQRIHIEESELFIQAKKRFSDSELTVMSRKYDIIKGELLDRMVQIPSNVGQFLPFEDLSLYQVHGDW